jgi:DNA polymerase elongation subunit (family B)
MPRQVVEMPNIIQPSDWYEHDVSEYSKTTYDEDGDVISKGASKKSYVVDVFGRMEDESVACIRITGFRPYFYCSKQVEGCVSRPVKKYDAMAGFNDLAMMTVYRIECESLQQFRTAIDNARGTVYESKLPPFMRMFHERHIGPATPIRVENYKTLEIPMDRETDEPRYNVEAYYEVNYKNVDPAPDASIPQLVASYDLEMYSATGLFPQASRDPIIQIGVSYRWSDDLLTPICRTVFVNGTVDPANEENTTFVACRNEKEMLLRFQRDIWHNNPDIMCGYNTFGFDDAYIEDRCRVLGIINEMKMGRCVTITKVGDAFKPKFSETKKFELASGKYDLRYMMLRGRLGLDLLLNMRREHTLDSFKLDNVASVFLRDKVVSYKKVEGVIQIDTKSTRGLRNGNYVRFDIVGNTTDPYREGAKFVVSNVVPKSFCIQYVDGLFGELTPVEMKSLEWCFTKDDVEPHELFALHRGTSADRARIAKYCIQDCDLVLTLMAKLDTLVNARGMADVCKVPMDYVLRRGQGIKIFSAVVYYAAQRDQIIQTQEAYTGDDGYEGAIVISPKVGMYLDQPIAVLDFNSLYPSNMIAYNLSFDTLGCERVFDAEGHKTSHEGLTMERIRELEDKGYVFDEVEYDNKDDRGNVVGRTVCTYVQAQADNPMTVGILPKTLDILLKKRKEFKDKMEDPAYDDAQRSVFNGLQLAYKVVANSVYGQTGSRTSPIRKMCVAACTTAAGRKQLYFAKRVVETEFGGKVVYGDTDSIFIQFPTKDLTESIQLGIKAGKRITEQCRKPYKIAYEKTFYPFILFCRKRYVGMLYEEDPNPAKAKRKSMGIVLKRRDNAPIVKDVFGGALDILLQERNVKKAQAFVTEMLLKVIENKVPLEKFVVTKALRDDYKTPEQIAHRVLADRMERRDPGTAPKVGDRIPYIYVAENAKAAKQGDRIEHLDYVRARGLKPDTAFYITNQIQNPVAQLFALCIESMDGYVPPRRVTYKEMYEQFMEKYKDEEQATLAVLDKKAGQLDGILFMSNPVLSKAFKRLVRGPLDAWAGRK